MRAANRGVPILLAVLAAGFLFGLWKLYQLRFQAGDIYPPYSSLRADPLGAKALYESLARIEGMSVSRNYRDVPDVARGKSTILFLGENPRFFEVLSEDELKQFENLAAGGAQVVIAMRPVYPESSKREKDDRKPATPLEKRWGVRFDYLDANKTDYQASGLMPRLTALYFVVADKPVHRWERKFGAGSVLLLPSAYPFSNEALAFGRDSAFIAGTLGANRKVVFDENHLGLIESGNIVRLGRKYHLEPFAAVLLLAFVLFVWKSSTSLLPPRAEAEGIATAVGDAGSGLANLLRRNIPEDSLIRTCFEQWEGSQHGGKFYSQAKITRARAAARQGGAVQAYRAVSRILLDRSER